MPQQEPFLALKAFKSWFTAHGGFIHPDLDFTYTPEAGVTLHVKASYRDTFPQNTLAISCPHELSLSALNAGKFGGKVWPPQSVAQGSGDDVLELPEKLRQQARPQFVAAVWVAVQYLLGEKSAWWPYFEVLPGVPANDAEQLPERGLGEIDTPMWWSAEERAWLNGTNLAKGIMDLEAVWNGEWMMWGGLVEVWGRSVGFDVSWKLVKYGLTLLGSRAFSSVQVASLVNQATGQPLLSLYNPDMLLYPGVDSLNHNPMTRNQWHSDDKVFGIVVEDKLTAGMEIWNPYGGKSNGELLLSYGFCLENNPCDSFAMKIGLPTLPVLQLIQQHQDTSRNPGLPLLSSQPPPEPTLSTSPMTPHNRPPCQDLSQNIFYIRPASRHYLQEAGYMAPFPPSFITNNSFDPASLDHALAGFPSHLINLFAAIELTAYEEDIIQSAPSSFSPNSFHLQAGERKHLATINLLLTRLNSVSKSYEQVLSNFEGKDGNDTDDDDATPATTSTTLALAQHTHPLTSARRHRRRFLVSVYLASQLEAINSNTRTLTLGMIHALTRSLHAFPSPSTSALNLLTSLDRSTLLLTTPTAVALLNAMTPGHNLGDALNEAMAFLKDTGYGNTGGVYHWSFVEHMRHREVEEIFWTLWVGLVAKVASASSTNGEAGGWFAFLRDAYGVVVPVARLDDDDDDSTEEKDDSLGSDESMADAEHDVEEYRTMDYTLRQLRARTSKDGTPHHHNDLWSCPPWTGAFTRACVDAVMSETLSIPYNSQGMLGREMTKHEWRLCEEMDRKRAEVMMDGGGEEVGAARERWRREWDALRKEQVMLDGEDRDEGGSDERMVVLYVGKSIMVPEGT